MTFDLMRAEKYLFLTTRTKWLEDLIILKNHTKLELPALN